MAGSSTRSTDRTRSSSTRSARCGCSASRTGSATADGRRRPVDQPARATAAHSQATARYNVYYGEGRDAYDVRGRVAHESIFNTSTARTAARALSRAIRRSPPGPADSPGRSSASPRSCEFVDELRRLGLDSADDRQPALASIERAAMATSDFYVETTPADGVPYWDTGAPGLASLGDYLGRPADPFNDFEPVDASAAAIAAQGLLRLGQIPRKEAPSGSKSILAGRPDGGAHAPRRAVSIDGSDARGASAPRRLPPAERLGLRPDGRKVPRGESAMWGDYHLRELALVLLRECRGEPWMTFW